MWLFTSKGFISVVQHLDDKDCLLVRARVREHLQALFPQQEVSETPDTDYRYRSIVNKKLVAGVVAEAVCAIDYGNFKDSVTDPLYHSSCLRVWTSMRQLQMQTLKD